MASTTTPKPRLVEGAIATLRSPPMMAVVVGPSLALIALAATAGQADQAIRAALFFSLLLFAAASWDAGETAWLKRYATSRGLRYDRSGFLRFHAMPGPPRRLGAYPNGCKTVLTGSIGGGPAGAIAVQFPNEVLGRYQTLSRCLPVVCYDLSSAGPGLATLSCAVRTVQGRIEYDPADDGAGRRLVSTELAGWLAQAGGVSFELAGGWLCVIDAGCPSPSSAGLDRLILSAAHVASHVLDSGPPDPSPSPAAELDRAAYGEVGKRIEAELRTLGSWTAPPPEQPVAGAFGAANASFTQWLQYVLCPRLQAVAAGTAEPPPSSDVTAKAVREFDGWPQADPLIKALDDLDHLVRP